MAPPGAFAFAAAYLRVEAAYVCFFQREREKRPWAGYSALYVYPAPCPEDTRDTRGPTALL